MKIAVWHNLPSGGGKRALFDHVSGLVAAGHEVEIWTPPSSDRDYLPLSDLAPEHVLPLEQPFDMNWRERWGLSSHAEHWVRAMDDHSRRCASEIDSAGFDVLFSNSCQFFRTTAIGRMTRTPSLHYLQEPYRWLYEAMPDNPWAALDPALMRGRRGVRNRFIDHRNTWNARIKVREEIRNAKAFDRVLCNSYFSRESILRAYGVDATVCYLGIDSNLFQAAQRKPAGHVVGLGAFTREKNVELAIRAVGAMAVPRPALVWIGNYADPSYLPSMTTLAKALDVRFEPRQRIADAELLDLLSGAIAMIYTPRLEPFGLAPLEANACGVPVVAVAEGGVRETVIDGMNGLLAGATPEALGAALSRLREDPALARRLGDTGRERVSSFWSKEQATARLIAELEQVAAHSPTVK